MNRLIVFGVPLRSRAQQNSVVKFAENYETRCPKDVMRLTTMSVKCHSGLRTRLNNVNTTASILSVGKYNM